MPLVKGTVCVRDFKRTFWQEYLTYCIRISKSVVKILGTHVEIDETPFKMTEKI